MAAFVTEFESRWIFVPTLRAGILGYEGFATLAAKFCPFTILSLAIRTPHGNTSGRVLGTWLKSKAIS
jgi:hypothetical protein